MQIVKTRKLDYNGESMIQFITVDDEPGFTRLIRKFPGSRWSRRLNSWLIPGLQDHISYLNKVFPAGTRFVDISVPGINIKISEKQRRRRVTIRHKDSGKFLELQFLFDRNLCEFLSELGGNPYPENKNIWKVSNEPGVSGRLKLYLDKENYLVGWEDTGTPAKNRFTKTEEKKYRLHLESLGYARRTADQYSGNIKRFLHATGADESNFPEKARDYIEEMSIRNRASLSLQNQVINSLKAYTGFKNYANSERNELVRPRRTRKTPEILSRQDVKGIIRRVPNLKHKVLISTLYNTGMKVSEVVSIRPPDVDMANMQIHVRGKDGSGSRSIPLSQELVEKIKDYKECYQPSSYLFEGQRGKQYTERSVQKVVKKYALKAGHTGKTSVSTLRHSFAGHLASEGVDFETLRKYLGYSSFRSTEIYRGFAAGKNV